MSKVLIIAEKPSVAKEIAYVVGSSKKVIPGKDARYGYYDGPKYSVSWCYGHLVQPRYPEDYDEKYKSWNIADLPIIPSVWKYSTDGPASKQYKVLRELLNSSEISSVICATDADREGELIFRLVYNQAKCRKSVQRLWISSMEESAIKEGMRNLRPGSDYDTLYHAADARQKADWIVGLNATRYFTARFSKQNSAGKTPVLTVGRVQTPTVNLIVERQLAIDNFKPVPYYVLTANTGSFKASLKESDKNVAEEKAKKCDGKEGVISCIEQEEKTSSPPELYDLTHLQQDADKMFSYSASQTLKLAQSLYEKKLLTYPRTDSRYLSSDMKDTAKTVVEGLLSSKFRNPVIQNAFDGKQPRINKIINDKKVSGHHAIIPTVTSIKADISSLNAQEKNIFQLVAIRMLAAVCVPQEYLSTKVVLEVAGEKFVAHGKFVFKNGWKDIVATIKTTEPQHTEEKTDDENLMQPLPPLKVGDRFRNVAVSCDEKFTSPPAVYTEATLLKDMQNISKHIEDVELKAVMSTVDDNGNRKMLGTAATQGGIIDKIIKTGYVLKKGRKLYPTEKAFALMEIVPEEIKSPEMTAEWEKRLEEIKDGCCQEKMFLDAIDSFIRDVIASVQKEYATHKIAPQALRTTPQLISPCPLCGKEVLKNKAGNYSCTGWKNGCQFSVFSTIAGKKLSESQVKSLLTKGRTGLIKGFKAKSGKSFDAFLVLDSSGKVNFEFNKR